jgi:hypothetical protein
MAADFRRASIRPLSFASSSADVSGNRAGLAPSP